MDEETKKVMKRIWAQVDARTMLDPEVPEDEKSAIMAKHGDDKVFQAALAEELEQRQAMYRFAQKNPQNSSGKTIKFVRKHKE